MNGAVGFPANAKSLNGAILYALFESTNSVSATSKNKKTMETIEKIEKLTLIEGCFSDAEAKEILLNVFSSKINFHQLKNFSSEVRFGKCNETAQKRIPELKKGIEKALQIVTEAKSKNKTLKITSDIYITFR